MKRILFLAFTTFLVLTLSACGKGKTSYEDLIVGDWVAIKAPVMTESGTNISFNDLKITYKKDKTSRSTGTLVMSSAMLPATLKLSLDVKATWSIEGDTINETVTDADIKMLTKIPSMPDMGNIMSQQLIGEGKGASTILKLDKKNLTVRETKSGMTISMKRK